MTRSKHPLHDRLMAFDMERNRFLPKGFVADLLRSAPTQDAMALYKAAILKNGTSLKRSTTQPVDE
jgi:hypothetical protein